MTGDVLALSASFVALIGAFINLWMAYRQRRQATEIVAASFRLADAAWAWRDSAEQQLLLTDKMLEHEDRLKSLERQVLNGR